MIDFFDPEYRKWCLQQYEEIRQRRNSFKGVPDKYDRLEIALDRIFLTFYKGVVQ